MLHIYVSWEYTFYFRFFGMPLLSSQGFDHLLNLVGPRIKKNDTIFSKEIPPVECLAITLRSLASGESQQLLAFFFHELSEKYVVQYLGSLSDT